MQSWQFFDYGLIDFKEFLTHQKKLWEARVRNEIPNTVVYADHTPAISLKNQGQLKHVRVTMEQLRDKNIPLFETSRGGSTAVHGPGILGCYVITKIQKVDQEVDLEFSFSNLLAQWTKAALKEAGAETHELPKEKRLDHHNLHKYHGLWQGDKKIVSIGAKISSHVTSFGASININPEEWLLNLIWPCGITEYSLGSLAEEKCIVDREELILYLSESAYHFLP